MGFFQLQVAENLTQSGLKWNLLSHVTEKPKCRSWTSSIAGFRVKQFTSTWLVSTLKLGFLRGFSIRFPTVLFLSFHPWRFKTKRQEQAGFPRNWELLTWVSCLSLSQSRWLRKYDVKTILGLRSMFHLWVMTEV